MTPTFGTRSDKTMSRDNYDVIHVNSSSWVLEMHALSIAKRHGIPLRIAHSHSSSFEQGFAKRVVEATFRPLVCHLATDYYACSKSAGEYLFGEKLWEKKGVLAPNGLDLERYAFSESNRTMVRDELGAASGSTVVGYVGTFKEQKNPIFLANLAIALCRKDKSLSFWFVGEGPCEPEMRERVSSSGVADRIIFLGTRTDISKLLHGMDALVLPSLSEGLGFVLIEAEAAGLPCFASEMVPSEAQIPGCPYTVLSLKDDADLWADAILGSDLSRNENGATQVASAGYGLGPNIEQLTALYLSPSRRQEVF